MHDPYRESILDRLFPEANSLELWEYREGLIGSIFHDGKLPCIDARNLPCYFPLFSNHLMSVIL